MNLTIKTVGTKQKKSNDAESFNINDIDEDGFIEGEIKGCSAVSAFNFGGTAVNAARTPTSASQIPQAKFSEGSGNAMQKGTELPKGVTPPVEGEFYTVKRCYQFRPSTVAKLNQLKARHPDFNAYLNTILDQAILHYYNYIVKQGGSFGHDFEE